MVKNNLGIAKLYAEFDKFIKKFGSSIKGINGINIATPNISKMEVSENNKIKKPSRLWGFYIHIIL